MTYGWDPDWFERFKEQGKNWGKELDLQYKLDTLSMKRTWQAAKEGNFTINTPLHMDLYIPKNTKLIQLVELRIRLSEYQLDSALLSTTPLGEKDTSTAVWGTETDLNSATASDGDHDHAGAVAPDGTHSHLQKTHYHMVSVPDHSHTVVHDIFHNGLPKDVGIVINGVDVTADLGGPFNEDQESLDITKYVQAIGWNDIMFYCGPDYLEPPRGRVRAAAFVEVYLP